MVVTCCEKAMLEKILVSEKELSDINFERLTYIKKNLIDSDSMYLTVDSLINSRNIINSSNNVTLRKVNFRLCGYDKMHIDKYLIEDKLYKLVD